MLEKKNNNVEWQNCCLNFLLKTLSDVRAHLDVPLPVVDGAELAEHPRSREEQRAARLGAHLHEESEEESGR